MYVFMYVHFAGVSLSVVTACIQVHIIVQNIMVHNTVPNSSDNILFFIFQTIVTGSQLTG